MGGASTFVLVHGAWHGGWCWRPVAQRLRAQGHDVFTPTMTGLGERAHLASPAVDLDTHIADLANVFLYEDIMDATLVLHSYGGWPGTGALEKIGDRVRALVYLDAFVPQDGEVNIDSQPAERRKQIEALRAQGAASRPVPRAADFAIADPRDVAWVDAKMTPHPIGVSFQPIRLNGARERVPLKVYVRATRYANPAFDRFHAQAQADPSWRAMTMDCGHHVMLDAPDALCALLNEIAALRG